MKVKDKEVYSIYDLEGDASWFVDKIRDLQQKYGKVYISIEQAQYSDAVDVYLVYEREETEAEKKKRLKQLERERAKKEKERKKKEEKERKLYEQLKKKFENQ